MNGHPSRVFCLTLALALVLAVSACQTPDKPASAPTPNGAPPAAGEHGRPPGPARPLPSPDGGIDQGGAIRPIPGSLFRFENDEKPEKAEETIAKVREIRADGHKLSDYFPKMLATAKLMNLKATDVVADIGAGTGLLAISMLEHDVPFAEMYAVDIDKPSLELGERILEALELPGRDKVKWVFSHEEDVSLPPASIDVAIFVNSPFYEARANEEGQIVVPRGARLCLESLGRALKDDGRVHVIEAAGDADEATKPRRNFELPFEEAGFKLKSVEESVFFFMAHYHFVWVKK